MRYDILAIAERPRRPVLGLRGEAETMGDDQAVAEAVDYYTTHLRRSLEHFLPDAVLEPLDRESSNPLGREGAPKRMIWELRPSDNGTALVIRFLGQRFHLTPGVERPFLAAERRLIEQTVCVLDERFRALFDLTMPGRAALVQHMPEDLIVAGWLDLPDAHRIPTALETLRAAALSTYENRELSTGAILLGTTTDPADPRRPRPPGPPRYTIRLSALKGIHRLCDGLHTLFLVDRAGDLLWPVDVAGWANQVHGDAPLPCPCPRAFVAHARATLHGDHVALVLMPSHEIKVFARGTWAFAFTHARWRLLDIPAKYDSWCRAVGSEAHPELADRLFRVALNMADERKGALLVVLRDAGASLDALLHPDDRMDRPPDAIADDTDHIAPHRFKATLHGLVLGRSIVDLPDTVLESLAGIDGAIVTDPAGRLLAFGAILRVPPATDDVVHGPTATGARSATAQAVSAHGPILKVSEDGLVSL